MQVELQQLAGRLSGLVGATLVVGSLTSPQGPLVLHQKALDDEIPEIDFQRLLASDASFTAEKGAMSTLIHIGSGDPPRRIVFIGLGKVPDHVSIRDAAMKCASTLTSESLISTLGLTSDGDVEPLLAAFEGSILGSYRWKRGDDRDSRLTITVAVPNETNGPDEHQLSVVKARAIATNWARRLVETPSSELNPPTFVREITERASEAGLTSKAWERADLEKNGFGGTLAVGSGSEFSPCVVELRNEGIGPKWGLAGKGITFDSGGLNLKKDSSELAWMKSDMAAAAAVAAAAIEAVKCNSNLNIHVILPIAENMPGAKAMRPGDVIVHPNGRTTEVTDTDSEGRLVLADALAWLNLNGADRLVDVGTLTDGGGVGPELWGCWGTDAELAKSAVAAGSRVGDPGWYLPLPDSKSKALESLVADGINAPLDRPDTGQIAATFLRPFSGDTPWLHIDNGSNAWQEFPSDTWSVGATGSPTRALIELLTS